MTALPSWKNLHFNRFVSLTPSSIKTTHQQGSMMHQITFNWMKYQEWGAMGCTLVGPCWAYACVFILNDVWLLPFLSIIDKNSTSQQCLLKNCSCGCCTSDGDTNCSIRMNCSLSTHCGGNVFSFGVGHFNDSGGCRIIELVGIIVVLSLLFSLLMQL